MERDYLAIHGFDLAPVTAAVQRAETDWPEKKADLDARLASETAIVNWADTQWQATCRGPPSKRPPPAVCRARTAARPCWPLRIVFFAHFRRRRLPKKAGELKTLSSQLYTSWDKMLVDMQARGDGNAREYDQQIRTVRTHLADAAAKTGDVTSDEQWNIVPKATYDAMQNNLGMAVEHKPAGKYDFEAGSTWRSRREWPT